MGTGTNAMGSFMETVGGSRSVLNIAWATGMGKAKKQDGAGPPGVENEPEEVSGVKGTSGLPDKACTC